MFSFSDENELVLSALMFFLRRFDKPGEFLLLLERDEHVRSSYEEEWINRYLDYDFFQLFRMKKETFEHLLHSIQCEELNRPYHGGQEPLSSTKALLMTLWWLGKGEALNSIADRFNVASSTVHNYCNVVLWRLVCLIPQYIVWPNVQEMATIENQFQQICGYPGVIGAIDGSNIDFKAPIEQQDSYIDKNDKHSIKLQGIATATRIFTNINVGFPGSVHDSRMFCNSMIYNDITEGNRLANYFPLEDYHLLGDKAYPLLGWLITPYKNYGNLVRRQQLHNLKHSRTRIKIEHTFGILKSRWRILEYINVNCAKKATKIIAACCLLHNFCYVNLDEWEYDEIVRDEEIEEGVEVHHIHNDDIGVLKRNDISNLFI